MILDSGTTALAVAAALDANLSATIITHCPTIASALCQPPDRRCVRVGWPAVQAFGSLCGAAVAEAASTISADLYFLGVAGSTLSRDLPRGTSMRRP